MVFSDGSSSVSPNSPPGPIVRSSSVRLKVPLLKTSSAGLTSDPTEKVPPSSLSWVSSVAWPVTPSPLPAGTTGGEPYSQVTVDVPLPMARSQSNSTVPAL